MRKAKILLGLCLLPCLVVTNASAQFHFDEQEYKLTRVLEWIDDYYVDSVNKEKLVEQAIYEMLKTLDPHSSYLTREEVIAMSEPLQGNFEGIGISFNILHDTVYVISPISGGPSDKAGLISGDRIVRVDGNNIAGIGITTDDVYAMLRGNRGSQVTLSVKRSGSQDLQDYQVMRDRIPIYSVDDSYKVSDDIGYIKINKFAQTTLEEYEDALKELKREGVSNLILDLTGNGGGYLDVAINLADQFLENNRLIVFTEGTNSGKKEYYATKDGNFEKGNLIILIDEGSASASEILSGAIQDWDRGIIVGRRSFGKGLVQKPLLLPDQSMIRLTIARYYTPSGRLIQKPYDMGREDYNLEIAERFNHGEFIHPDSIHLADSLKFYTLENTRVVYGGGGIMPDYFVSLDTSYYTDYYSQLASKEILTRFALEYVDRNRKGMQEKYADFEAYKNTFAIDENIRRQLVDYAWRDGIAENSSEYAISKDRIELLLKAHIARDLWSNSEFYEVLNEGDEKFQTAVMILRNWNKYEASLLNKQ